MTTQAGTTQHMTDLRKLALKIKHWEGPADTRHDAMATDVMFQVYFRSEDLTGAYISPPQDVTASYIQREKAFFIGVHENLLEAFLEHFEADLAAPGESKKTFDVTCGNGSIKYSLVPYEPFDTSQGQRKSNDEDLWGFMRGDKARTFRIDDMMAVLPEVFNKCGIDAGDMRIAPQRNKQSGGITCIDSSFTVNGLTPKSSQGYYPVENWPAYLMNVKIGTGFMSFECSHTLAQRLGICSKCLRETQSCTGHGKAVKRKASSTTMETPQEKRDREVQAVMAAMRRKQARRSAGAGTSGSGSNMVI
jgi:hypothetical protein